MAGRRDTVAASTLSQAPDSAPAARPDPLRRRPPPMRRRSPPGESRDDDERDRSLPRASPRTLWSELRTRLIVCVAWRWWSASSFCFFFSQQIYLRCCCARSRWPADADRRAASCTATRAPSTCFFAITGLRPLHRPCGEPERLVFTAPLEFFFTKMKLAGFGALMICFPVIAWQLYRFVAPGLYKRERNGLSCRSWSPRRCCSCMGAALVYYLMLPFVLWFSLSQQIVSAPTSRWTCCPRSATTSTWSPTCCWPSGCASSCRWCCRWPGLAGLVEASATLAKGRRYAILGIVVVAAVVTPPDPLSQVPALTHSHLRIVRDQRSGASA